MRCYRCRRGEMVTQHVRFQMEADGDTVFVNNVPARVCTQCGERVYSAVVLRRLGKIREQIRRGDVSPKPAENVKQLVYAASH